MKLLALLLLLATASGHTPTPRPVRLPRPARYLVSVEPMKLSSDGRYWIIINRYSDGERVRFIRCAKSQMTYVR